MPRKCAIICKWKCRVLSKWIYLAQLQYKGLFIYVVTNNTYVSQGEFTIWDTIILTIALYFVIMEYLWFLDWNCFWIFAFTFHVKDLGGNHFLGNHFLSPIKCYAKRELNETSKQKKQNFSTSSWLAHLIFLNIHS